MTINACLARMVAHTEYNIKAYIYSMVAHVDLSDKGIFHICRDALSKIMWMFPL